MARQDSAALPIAYVALRILIVLNWIYGACILAILAYSFINEPFLLRALKLASLSENPNIVVGIRAIAVLGLASIPLNLAVLKRLIAMIQTVRAGDAFVGTNAHRLRAIAWVLLFQQLLSLLVGIIAKSVSTAAHPFHVGASFSVNGWLAVILTFVLAGVFAEGSLMRQDLQGTV